MAGPRISNEIRVYHTLISRRLESEPSAWLHRSEELCAARSQASTSYGRQRTSNSRQNQEAHQAAQALSHTIAPTGDLQFSAISEMELPSLGPWTICLSGYGSKELASSLLPSSFSDADLSHVRGHPQQDMTYVTSAEECLCLITILRKKESRKMCQDAR